MKRLKSYVFLILISTIVATSCAPAQPAVGPTQGTAAPATIDTSTPTQSPTEAPVVAPTKIPPTDTPTPVPEPPLEERINSAKIALAQEQPITSTYLIDLYDSLPTETVTTTNTITTLLEGILGGPPSDELITRTQKYLEFAVTLKALRDGTYNEPYDQNLNACRTKSHTIPFKIGPPFWWYVLSFHQEKEARACFVRYDTEAATTPSLNETENCDAGFHAFVDPETVTIKSADNDTNPRDIIDKKLSLFASDSSLKCFFFPDKGGAKEGEPYNEFWIKFVGTYTGTALAQDAAPITKTLASIHDPEIGITQNMTSLIALSLVLLPGGADWLTGRLVTTLNGIDYSSIQTFTIPVSQSFAVGTYFKAATQLQPSIFKVWYQSDPSLDSPSQISDLSNVLPITGVLFYKGGFGAVSIGLDERTRTANMQDFLIDEIIFDPGPGRGGI